MLTGMPTLQDLETALAKIEGQTDDSARVVADVLKKEIARRRNAGRPRSPIDSKERNRLNQQRFRKGLTSKRK